MPSMLCEFSPRLLKMVLNFNIFQGTVLKLNTLVWGHLEMTTFDHQRALTSLILNSKTSQLVHIMVTVW